MDSFVGANEDNGIKLLKGKYVFGASGKCGDARNCTVKAVEQIEVFKGTLK